MRPEFHIRPFAPGDEAPIDRLLDDLWGHDPAMLAVSRIHKDWGPATGLLRTTLVAAHGGTVIGAGTLFESTLHPAHLLAGINVAGGWQRRGAGSQVYAELRRLSPARPWMARLSLRDQAGVRFAGQRGFRRLANTLSGTLSPDRPETRRWIEALPPPPDGCAIRGIDGAAGDPAPLELARLHAALYAQSHQWSPPAPKSDGQALRQFCGEAVLAGSQLAAYARGQLVGAANLIAHPHKPASADAYLVNVGVLDGAGPLAGQLCGALIRRSLEWAAARGLRVEVEADDSSALVRGWLELAPFSSVDRDFVIVAALPPEP
ncbi:MAG TPA: hypothetical protein VD886_15830 [Herpetosiphonaceae bacterium]|nr:hypothetical protein [Herpetosiphonaceae bacterium]